MDEFTFRVLLLGIEELIKQGTSDVEASEVHWTRTRKPTEQEQAVAKANEELFEEALGH